ARSLAAHACARQLARFQYQLKLRISCELRIGETSAADRVRGDRGYFGCGGMGLRRYHAACSSAPFLLQHAGSLAQPPFIDYLDVETPVAADLETGQLSLLEQAVDR